MKYRFRPKEPTESVSSEDVSGKLEITINRETKDRWGGLIVRGEHCEFDRLVAVYREGVWNTLPILRTILETRGLEQFIEELEEKKSEITEDFIRHLVKEYL